MLTTQLNATNDWQLSQGVGYAVILGFGAFFSIVMSLLAYWARRYMGESNSAEFFNTAGRSLKTGLTAAAVVSAWTWSATLLQSSTVAYSYGVSGPYWYGAGACVQIILFSILAIMLKRRAPNARTFAEIMRVRYGPTTHKIYTFVSILTNTVIMITLLLGGAVTAAALTGMNVYAAIWLTPVGVVFYTMAGGLKATFLTDYSHAIIIFAMIVAYMFATYATSSVIGSAGRMYDLLQDASKRHPVTGNAEGSYLTMKSEQGSTFGVIQIITCFGVSFADQAIWQRAVAARAEATVVSYIIGGAAWFAIPFGLATTLGLAAIALETDPSFPTYPLRMSSEQVSGGLVAPFAAAALGGVGGSVAMLIMIYMAITSCMSAELVAVTSVCEYDIYREYVNRNPTDKQQKHFGRAATIIYVLLLSALCSVLHSVGVDLGFVYMIMGIITGPAVGPLVMALTWKGQNKWGANLAILLGLPAGIAAWLGYTANIEHDVNDKVKLMGNYPSLAGNLTALLGGIGISLFFSLLAPQNFDWTLLKNGIASTENNEITPEQDKKMRWATKLAATTAITITICFLILFPIPLSETRYVFSKGFFGFWVGLAIAWALVDVIVILLLPIWESRSEISVTARGFWLDLTTGFKLDTATVQDRLGYVANLEKEIQAGKLATDHKGDEGIPLAYQHGDKTSNTTPSISKNESEEKTNGDAVPLAQIHTFSSATNLNDVELQQQRQASIVASHDQRASVSTAEYNPVTFHV